jgi:Spy/CpxP family protein refolding chaperone
MSKRWITAMVFASVVAVTTGFASPRYGRGQQGMGGFPFLHELGIAKVKARLNLTADQTDQIQQIARSERMKRSEQGGFGAEDRQALLNTIFADNPNQTEIQKRVQALQEQHEKMLQEMVATGLQVNKVFTPEQRTELRRMIDENAQVRAEMRDRRMQRQHQREQDPAPQP